MHVSAVALGASFLLACSSGSDAPPVPQPVVPPPVVTPPVPPPPPPPIALPPAPIAPAVELTAAPGAMTANRQQLVGEGFAIEVPLGFAPVAHPTAGQAWAGTRRDGLGNPARIVAWAAVEPGTELQAYADARSAAITAAGGEVRVVNDANLFGFRPGVPNRPAKRIVATTPELRLMIQFAIVDGRVYAITCESPRRSLADADCGSIVASLQML